MLLKDFLSSYKDYNSSIGDGELLKITHDKEMTAMTLYVACKDIVEEDEISDFCGYMKETLGLQQFFVKAKYTPDKFSPSYFPRIIAEIKKKNPIVNGILDGAKAWMDTPDKLSVELLNGGYEVIEPSNPEKMISDEIFDVFSKRIM